MLQCLIDRSKQGKLTMPPGTEVRDIEQIPQKPAHTGSVRINQALTSFEQLQSSQRCQQLVAVHCVSLCGLVGPLNRHCYVGKDTMAPSIEPARAVKQTPSKRSMPNECADASGRHRAKGCVSWAQVEVFLAMAEDALRAKSIANEVRTSPYRMWRITIQQNSRLCNSDSISIAGWDHM